MLAMPTAIVVLSLFASPALAAGAGTPDLSRSADDPFVLLNDVPMVVDAAAVFNNPAQRFLLKDSGRSIRKLLAMGGIFRHTEHAWSALAEAFDAEPDATIRALLSRRVVVVWDGIGSPRKSVFGFAHAIDTHWTLVCEVDPAYLREIRDRLDPVRRRIKFGHAVYAIEMGRYEIVLLDQSQGGQENARVILAPQTGSTLLDHVLESFVDKSQHPDVNAGEDGDGAKFRSITNQRARLLSSVAPDGAPDGAPWAVAWIIQLDPLLDHPQPKDDAPSSSPDPSPAIVGVLNTSERGVSVQFATDINLELPEGDAPVGLLSAVGGDAIVAIALAQTSSLFGSQDLFKLMHKGIAQDLEPSTNHEDTPDQTTATSTPPTADNTIDTGPGLILLSELSIVETGAHQSASDGNPRDARPVGLTVMTRFSGDEHAKESVARRVDRSVHALFKNADRSGVADYQGAFPDAIRTQPLDAPPPDAASPTGHSARTPWPGEHARLSWIASDLPSGQTMILSMAPEPGDTARQVRWIAEAAQNLDSIPDHTQRTGVITMGYFHPAQAVSLMGSASAMDLAISKLVQRIDWDIARAPFGLRGSGSIEFADLAGLTNLGNTRTE